MSPRTLLGVVTFDATVHFHDIGSASTDVPQHQMLVTPDVDDPFCPMLPRSLMREAGEEELWEGFFELLPELFPRPDSGAVYAAPSTVFGAALGAAAAALGELGGKIIGLTGSIPSRGAGKLRNRDDRRAMGTDREGRLRRPANDYYTELGTSCAKQHVSVDLYLLPHDPSASLDLFSLAQLPRLTCGRVQHMPGFCLVQPPPTPLERAAQLAAHAHSPTVEPGCRAGARLHRSVLQARPEPNPRPALCGAQS